jgi:hypothetical protein
VNPGRILAWCAALSVFNGLTACAPPLNWREVHPEQSDDLAAMFPCKPDVQSRALKWPGVEQEVTVRVLTCQAGELTWTLSYFTLPDASQIGTGLLQWPALTRVNLATAAKMSTGTNDVTSRDEGVVDVPHMTPMPQAHAWRFEAPRSDGLGRPLDMVIRTWHFSHGLTLFQASVSGAADLLKGQSSEDVTLSFFRGFHFRG